jgi:diguanylate cyclase (GGDEF)-like protein
MTEGSRPSQEGSWLCPTELDRMRLVEANARVRKIRQIGSGAIGLALVIVAPWIGWWTLILFAIGAFNLWHIERRMARSPRPERVSAWGVCVTAVMLALGVALSGGPRSPALPWMVLPAAMVAARFRPQVVVVGLALTVLLMLCATFAVAPAQATRDPTHVITTLALLASVVSIVRALQAAELRHRDEAILDPLTGLLNRHALGPRFKELSQQARLTGQPVCLLLCDIDGFKRINDDFGHDRGDAVLRDVAYELRKRLRSFELVYRLGGEEFLVVLPGIDRDVGRELAERLRMTVASAQPTGIATTISVGVSAASGDQVVYEPLFKAADEALYAAKRSGRNQVSVAPVPPSAEVAAAELAQLPTEGPPQTWVAASAGNA